tara:strand:- start:6457 stop:6645 length:189 start_codon:yes stop_codon:yes gene_type:complete
LKSAGLGERNPPDSYRDQGLGSRFWNKPFFLKWSFLRNGGKWGLLPLPKSIILVIFMIEKER